MQGRQKQPDAGLGSRPGKIGADAGIRRNAAGHDQLVILQLPDGVHRPGHQALADGGGKAGTEGGLVQRLLLLLGIVNQIDHGGLETGKAEVIGVTGHMADGELIFRVVPALGEGIHRLAAGIAQTQHPGGFVKAFAGSIVPGRAENVHIRVIAHIHQQCVAAGDGQTHKGRLQLRKGDVVGGDVAADVVYRDQGNAKAKNCGLGKINAHQHSANQAGGIADGNSVQLPAGDAGLRQRPVGKLADDLHMAAGGDFRHDTAVNGVEVGLGEDLVGEYLPTVPGDRHRSFVTGGFHRKDQHNGSSFFFKNFVISIASSLGSR